MVIMKNDFRETINGIASTASTECTNNQQWTKYHNKHGHGFAAEDANAFWDRIHGKTVEKVGYDNSLNGPDRISNGVMIQTKYHANASKSVASAFENGSYRYGSMKLEVPRDQYDEAIRLMRSRIANGEVPGITDPKMAEQMVLKGHYTYKEAVRIAKAGNIDSIKFDIQTQTVACAFACGLSFTVTYFSAKSKGMSHIEALKTASKQSLESGCTTMITGVVAQQLLRTQVGRDFAAKATKAVRPLVGAAVKTEVGKQMITKTASAIVGRQVTVEAATNVVTKALRTNAVVSSVVFVGTTIPDTIKLCRGKISGKEFAENTVSNAASVGGGWIGASAGAAAGSMICPGIGTVIGGIVGGLGIGMGASIGTKKVFRFFS